MIETTIADCILISLPKINNRAGNLTSLEFPLNTPFCINRVYYIYDIPSGETRGGHAHKSLLQLIVPISGSFDVVLNDSIGIKTITLNQPNIGLFIKNGIWRDLINFSSGSVCLVLASEKYNELDYIRDYDTFVQYKSISIK
jgi:dTDP-4-dehydrorhamnose 3,5-epimerase-like enzyme